MSEHEHCRCVVEADFAIDKGVGVPFPYLQIRLLRPMIGSVTAMPFTDVRTSARGSVQLDRLRRRG